MRRSVWVFSHVLAFATLAADGSASSAQENVQPAGINDAGIRPENVVPAILHELKKSMKDPYSIRDLRVCVPKVSPAFKYPGAGNVWEPAHWSVAFELNAKNGFGAYSGRTYFAANYKDGRLVEVASPNLGPSLNQKLLQMTENCSLIPDEQIQNLLNS